jgi:hypothetical protein
MLRANEAAMAKAAPAISPIFRAAWADMVANDRRLSHRAVRVGLIVAGHFNNYTAETFVGQTTIAAKAGISARAAWEDLKNLVECGHLTKRRGGRSSNTYGMPLENVAAYCEIYFAKCRSGLRNLPPEISQNPAQNFAVGCEQTLLTNSINSADDAPATPQARIWQAVLCTLTDRYGPDIIKSWFTGLTFVGIRDGACILGAPTAFIKTWITSNYQDAILRAWRTQDIAVSRIEIEVVPQRHRGAAR